MRKIIWIILSLVFLSFVGYYAYLNFYNIKGKVNTKSQISNLQLNKSENFGEFETFLDERGFWSRNSVKSQSTRQWFTIKDLTITITDVSQGRGFLKVDLSDNDYFSSYKYEVKNNRIELFIHINPDLCQPPKCDLEKSLNRQIIKALYQATSPDYTENNSASYSLFFEKYNKIYFNLDESISTKLINFISNFQFVSTAHAGCTWFCAYETCDDAFPTPNCTYGPSGYDESSSGTDCSVDCPDGQAQSISCSGCGGPTPPGGGGGSCNLDYLVNCTTGGPVTEQVESTACVGFRNACKNPDQSVIVGSAQEVTGCCEENAEGGCARVQITTYMCCPANTVSSCTYSQQQYIHSCTWNEACQGPYACSPGYTELSRTQNGSCGWTPKDEEGQRYYVCGSDVLCQSDAQVATCNCVPVCNTTAPSGINYTNSNQTLTWNIGSNGTSQKLYVSRTQSDVTNDCGAGTSCTASNGSLLASATSYPLTGLLTPATTYYVKIVTYKDSGCSSPTNYSFVTPIADTPWWQVKDGDVTTNSDISSTVPATKLFDIVGLGGYPGVPVYGGSLSTGTGQVSATLWNADTTTIQSRIFNYSYFKNLVPDDVLVNDINNLLSGSGATIDEDGYEWYQVTGNLDTASDIDFGSRKVILLIESGDLNIGGKVNLTDNTGFFGAFVNGNINISPTVTGVPSIEGVYLADSGFNTGAGTVPLHVRGSVAVYGSANLERDLTDDANPAELFEFAPDQMFLFPESLAFRRTKWAEIAP